LGLLADITVSFVVLRVVEDVARRLCPRAFFRRIDSVPVKYLRTVIYLVADKINIT
jgi:hypothetical protein